MPPTELTGKSSDLLRVVLPAAARGDLASVRRFVARDPRWVFAVGPHDRTMLWEACYRGREEAAGYLIDQGADVNAAGTYCTPLLVDLTPHCLALASGRMALADQLAENGALTDIHSAAYLGDVAGVETWLARDATLLDAPFPAAHRELVDGRGSEQSLTKTLQRKRDVIESELERCFDADLCWARGVLGREKALTRERTEAFDGRGCDFRAGIKRYEVLIAELAAGGRPTKRQLLGRRGLSLDRRAWLDRWRRALLAGGHRPLHYAVAGNQIEVVRTLLDRGAEIEPDGGKLLDWASDPDREAILLALIEQGAEPTMAAAGEWAGDSRLSKIAARFGFVTDINAPDRGFPPLVDACRGNHNAPDDPDRVRALLERGADIQVRDHKGKTALHRAAQAGFTKITALVIAAGADLEARDICGETPLFDAVRAGRPATVALLLAEGASPAAANGKGQRLLDLAKRVKKTDAREVVAMLEKSALRQPRSR